MSKTLANPSKIYPEFTTSYSHLCRHPGLRFYDLSPVLLVWPPSWSLASSFASLQSISKTVATVMLWKYKSGHIFALELGQWPVRAGWFTRALHLSDLISLCSPLITPPSPTGCFRRPWSCWVYSTSGRLLRTLAPRLATCLASQCFSVTFPVKPPLGTPFKIWNSPHSWNSHHLSWLHVSSLLSLSYIGRNFCLFFFNLFNAVSPVFKTVPNT